MLKVIPEPLRVSLSHKEVTADPFVAAVKRYRAGAKVSGTVIGNDEYGLMMELEPGVEGMVPPAEMTEAASHLHSRAPVTAKVLRVDESRRRFVLGMLGPKDEPRELLYSQALDALSELRPNLAASLNVLVAMAQAHKMDPEELARARNMAAQIADGLQALCKKPGTRAAGPPCTKATQGAAKVRAALKSPSVEGLTQAGEQLRMLHELFSSW